MNDALQFATPKPVANFLKIAILNVAYYQRGTMALQRPFGKDSKLKKVSLLNAMQNQSK